MKTALVTGCKRGIGKAMAIGLAEAGANIIGVSTSLELEGGKLKLSCIIILLFIIFMFLLEVMLLILN